MNEKKPAITANDNEAQVETNLDAKAKVKTGFWHEGDSQEKHDVRVKETGEIKIEGNNNKVGKLNTGNQQSTTICTMI